MAVVRFDAIEIYEDVFLPPGQVSWWRSLTGKLFTTFYPDESRRETAWFEMALRRLMWPEGKPTVGIHTLP